MWNPRRTPLAAAFAVALLPLGLLAQQENGRSNGRSEAKLREQRAAKRKAPFLKKYSWYLSLAEARVAAAQSGRPILIYFTRSYEPSPPCDALEAELLSTPEFAKVASRVELLCHISSRVDGDPDSDLFARFGAETYPHVAIADQDGRRIASLDRITSIADIQARLDGEVATFEAARKAAAKGGKAAKARFFMLRLGLGHLSPAEIEKTLATADFLSDAQRRSIRGSLANLEVVELLTGLDAEDPKSRDHVATHMVAMEAAGRIPTDRYAFAFWQVLLGQADRTEDPALLRRALENIKRISGDKADPKWVKRMETRLRAMEFMQERKDRK